MARGRLRRGLAGGHATHGRRSPVRAKVPGRVPRCRRSRGSEPDGDYDRYRGGHHRGYHDGHRDEDRVGASDKTLDGWRGGGCDGCGLGLSQNGRDHCRDEARDEGRVGEREEWSHDWRDDAGQEGRVEARDGDRVEGGDGAGRPPNDGRWRMEDGRWRNARLSAC